MTSALGARGRALILNGQDAGGAYVAAPDSAAYGFGWLRDGAFCALAMDAVGEHASAAAFHAWAARAVCRHRVLFAEASEQAAHGEADPARMPPALFTLAGELEPPAEGGESWPNFQLDCYGTWLWALHEHVGRGGELTDEQRAAARIVSAYLQVAGTCACIDCWEEHPGLRHTSTLAAVVAGLRGAARLLDDPSATAKADAVVELIGAEQALAGAFVRSSQDTRVDASLLWLVVPYDVVRLEDPVMLATIKRVRQELTGSTGGLRRYLGDTFYGGSEWILTTAFLAMVDLRLDARRSAEAGLAWIEAQATPALKLPEHVPLQVSSPHMLDYWRARWGPPTCPLLWSHAMHLLLLDALARKPAAT